MPDISEAFMEIGIVSWNPQFCYHRVKLTYPQYKKYEELGEYHSLSEAADYALRVGRLTNNQHEMPPSHSNPNK